MTMPPRETWPTLAERSPLLEPVSFQPSMGYENDRRVQSRPTGYRTDVPTDHAALLRAAADLVDTFHDGTATLAQAIDLDTVLAMVQLVRDNPPLIWAYATIKTYDPNGTFSPGREAVFSAHATAEEAEIWRAHWESLSTRAPEDLWSVGVRAVKMHYLCTPGSPLPKNFGG